MALCFGVSLFFLGACSCSGLWPWWWNRQTRPTQNRVPSGMGVRIPPRAHAYSALEPSVGRKERRTVLATRNLGPIVELHKMRTLGCLRRAVLAPKSDDGCVPRGCSQAEQGARASLIFKGALTSHSLIIPRATAAMLTCKVDGALSAPVGPNCGTPWLRTNLVPRAVLPLCPVVHTW